MKWFFFVGVFKFLPIKMDLFFITHKRASEGRIMKSVKKIITK